MKGEKVFDDERERGKPGLSKSSMRSQRNDADQIDKKLREIKDQKAHFNEMTGSLESLVTPVNSKTLTKSEKKQDSPDKQALTLDDLPSGSAASISQSVGQSAVAQPEKEVTTEEISIDPVANMFVMQPDGTHECYAGESPITPNEQVPGMREVRINDGELIILTGGNGEIVYHPEDTVAIDINDSRVFVVDAQESGVSFVQATESQEELDIDSIIEFLPEEQDTTTMEIDGGVQSASCADVADTAQLPSCAAIQEDPDQVIPVECDETTQPPEVRSEVVEYGEDGPSHLDKSTKPGEN
ncbi:uncharacterized protein LOC119556168 [Drosophila subpulchrella]|uniref:uncharacterized protein LOC119556168 n=1 Tax=Drosophila subpulchrella TaxID=1486046 RepID=UPI0018A17040|nr:uncharacterized protein LOC119556168 [Drosophila subpulchrella]